MSFQLQQTIRNNAQELKQYVNDLHDWESQMETKEKIKKQQKTIAASQPTTTAKKQEEQISNVEEAQKMPNQMRRDINTVQSYYEAWDKYDPDMEVAKLQQQQKRSFKPYNPYEDARNVPKAKPQSKVVVRGTRNVGGANILKDPTSLKDKGNLHFKVGEYAKAESLYSQCIDKIKQSEVLSENDTQLLSLVYSNRAMTYIKTNQTILALSDCNTSIVLNPNYSKTYLRRASCLRKLGKYKQSLTDYKKVQELVPQQPQAKTQIKVIEQFLKRRAKQTQASMVVEGGSGAISGGYRVNIEDIEDFQEQKTEGTSQPKLQEKPTNYLEQL